MSRLNSAAEMADAVIVASRMWRVKFTGSLLQFSHHSKAIAHVPMVGTAAAPAKRRATVHRICAPTRAAHHAFSSGRRALRSDGDRISEARVVIRAEPIAAI